MTEINKSYENYYRSQAKRLHLLLEKSRARKWGIDNQLGWRILDPYKNTIVAGEKYDLTIEEAAEYLDNYETEMRKKKG